MHRSTSNQGRGGNALVAAFVVGLCMVPLSNAQALDSSCLARTETTTQHRPFFHRVGVVSPVVNVDFLLIEAFNGTGLVGGAVVGTLVGADSDTGDQLFFALVPSSVSHLFRINSSTTSVSLTTAGDIDYEGAAQDFRISLRVFDRDPSGLDLGAALCADVAIALLVLDANDHAPAFTRAVYTASFPEDAAIGFNTNAMRVTAADSDSGLNGRFGYSIIGGNEAGRFRIGSRTGQVRTNGTFDFESQSFYSLLVQATDLGTPPQSSTVRVNITIIDVNDNPPVLLNTTVISRVARDVNAGALIAQFSATDADTGVNSGVLFAVVQESYGVTIVTDPTQFRFDINRSTGEVTLNRTLCDSQGFQTSQVSVLIRAFDATAVSLQAFGTLLVQITELAPEPFSVSNYHATIDTETQSGTRLLNVSVTGLGDPCANPVGVVYSLAPASASSSDDSADFRLDRTSGELTLLRQIAAPDGVTGTITLRFLVIAAENGVVSPRTVSANITVTVNQLDTTTQILASFEHTGTGFLLGAAQALSNGTDRLDAGFFIDANNISTATVALSWGGLRHEQMVTRPQRLSATSAIVSILSTEIRGTDRLARAEVGVRDAYGGSQVQRTVVTARLEPEVALRAIDNTAITTSCVVSASTIDGSCALAFTLPAAFFDPVQLPAERLFTARMFYSIGGAPEIEVSTGLTLFPNLRVNTSHSVSDAIVVVSKTRAAYAGQTATLAVLGRATYEFSVFTVVLVHDESVATPILPVVTDPARWSITATRAGGRTVISGTVRTSYTLRDTPLTAPEPLFEIDVALATGAALDAASQTTVTVTAEQLVEHRLGVVAVRPTVYVDDRGFGTTGAQITVIHDTVLSTVAHTPRAHLLNTALLDGRPVSATISTKVCRSCFRATPLQQNAPCGGSCQIVPASQVQCSTTAGSAVLGLDGCRAFLSAMQTTSALVATVVVTASGVSTTVTFRTWTPDLPVRIAVDRATVNAVSGFRSGGTCIQTFQAAGITVSTNLTSGAVKYGVDITSQVMDRLVVGDTQVAVVEPGNGTGSLVKVRGRSAGITHVRLLRGTTELGFAPLSVAAESVAPVRLQIFSRSYTPLVSWELENRVESYGAVAISTDRLGTVLRSPGQQLGLLVVLHTSDGTRTILSASDGLVVTSTDPSVIAVAADGRSATAISSGNVTLSAAIETGGCQNTALSANLAAQVSLDDPSAIEITLVTHRLAGSTDSASALALPTTSAMSVVLVYPSGTRVDVTDSPHVRVLPSPEISLHNRTGGGIELRAVASGVAVVTVVLTNMPALLVAALPGNNISMSVVTVTSSRIFPLPFPEFPRSANQDASVLNAYANVSSSGGTAVFQQAVLQISLGLSDGSLVNVSGLSPAVQFRAVVISGDSLAFSLGAVANGRVVVTVGSAADADVEATVGTLRVTPVRISSVLAPVFVSQLVFQPAISTLRGVHTVGTTDIGLSGVFSDGTILESLVLAGTPVLPGLVTFSVVNGSGAAAVNSVSGRLSILANSVADVALAATAPGIGATSVIAVDRFSCNLDPDTGDVDLGQLTGSPLGSIATGSVLSVEIRVNGGSQPIGPFEFDFSFNAASIEPVNITVGRDLATSGGVQSLLGRINDPPGELLIVGVPIGQGIRGTAVHLCTISFRVLNATGRSGISGQIRRLVEPGVAGTVTPIGVQGRAIIAGDVPFIITNSQGRRHRRDTPAFPLAVPQWIDALHPDRLRRQSACLQDRLGDTNADCAYDVIDVGYTSEFVVESLVNFQGSFGAAFNATPPSQLARQHMDADGSGVIDASDVLRLARGIVGQTRFVETVSSIAVNSTGCVLRLETVVTKGDGTVDTSPANRSQTLVYFVLASTTPQFAQLFAASNDSCPSCIGTIIRNQVSSTSTPVTTFGGLVAAQRSSTDPSVYTAAITTDLTNAVVSQLGLSVVVATRDANLQTAASRVAFLGGAAAAPSFADTVLIVLPDIQEQLLIVGHNPKIFVNNTFESSQCFNVFTPQLIGIPLGTVRVSERIAANTVLFTVNATDADAGNGGQVNLTLDLFGGDVVALNSSTGALTIARAVLQGNFTFAVVATDQSPPFNRNVTNVTLEVTPTFVSFVDAPYAARFLETAVVGTSLLSTISVRNEVGALQLPGLLEFIIVNRTDAAAPLVTLNNATGEIRVASPVDFEATQSISLNISARELVYPFNTATASVQLDVIEVFTNDNQPTFEQADDFPADRFTVSVSGEARYEIRIPPTLGSDMPILRIVANDTEDFENGTSPVLRLVSVTPAGFFRFNASDGMLFALGGSTLTTSDVTHQFQIEATDLGGVSTIANISVTTTGDLAAGMFRNQYTVTGGTLGFSGFGPSLLDVSEPFVAIPSPQLTPQLRAILGAAVDGLSFDRRSFRVAVQAHDAQRGTAISGQAVRVFFQLESALTADLQAGQQTASLGPSTCTTRSSDGTCTVTVTIPTAWFSALRVSTRTFTVRYGASTSSLVAATPLGTVLLHRRSTVSVTPAVVVQLPQRSLAIGEQITVPVVANAGFSVSAWQLRVQIDPRLQIVRAVINQRKWTAQTQSSSPTLMDLTGFLADESSAAAGAISGYEVLFALVLRVLSAPTACNAATGVGCLALNGTMLRMSSVRDPEVAINQAIRFEDRYSSTANGNQVGLLSTYVNRLAGAFSVIGQTGMINTARLNGVAVRLTHGVIGLSQYGTTALQPVASALRACTSAGPNTVKVESACDSIFVDGSETVVGGAQGTTISMRVVESGVTIASSSFNVVVWQPTTPIDLRVSNTQLHRVRGWSATRISVCVPGYQTAVVSAFANFSNGVRTISGVRVTAQIVPALVSTQTTIAQVTDGVVSGVGPGVAQLAIQHSASGSAVLGVLDINVLSAFVQPTMLVVSVAKRLDVSESTGGAIRSPFDLGSEQVYTITLNRSLNTVDDVGGVSVFVAFENSPDLMQVTPADGLRLQIDASSAGSLELAVGDTATRNSRVVAVDTRAHAQVNATWASCDGAIVASGEGRINVSTALPIRVEVDVQFTELSITNDPLALRGMPVVSTFSVVLVYATPTGERRKPVANDPRTVYDLSAVAQHVSLCNQPTNGRCLGEDGLQIATVSTSPSAAISIGVSFTHTNLTAQLQLQVVTTRDVRIALNPFPEYTGSRSFSVTALNRYGNNFSSSVVYQQAKAYLSATMENGTTFTFAESLASFGFTPLTVVGYNVGSRVISNGVSSAVLQQGDQTVAITCTVGRIVCTPTSLRVSHTAVQITQLDPPRLNSQSSRSRSSYDLVGLSGATDQIVLGATFSDGSKHPVLLTATGTPLLDGLLTFTSALPLASSVTPTGGVVLHANHYNTVPISVTVRGNAAVAPAIIQLSCNLNPAAGDVDLGSVTGVPLGPASAGQVLTVPVRVNTDGSNVGAVEILVLYDASRFDLVGTVSRGGNWPGGVFEAVNDPPGTIILGGSPSGTFRGSAAELAVIQLRVLPGSATLANITGMVRTLNEPPSVADLGGLPIGVATPRLLVAGAIHVSLGSRRGRRESDDDLAPEVVLEAPDGATLLHRDRRQSAQCNGVLPCAACAGVREQGDANGDCVFDLRDVSYAQVYILEAVNGFQTARGQTILSRRLQFQLSELDSDMDGTISALDARFLARVNFGLLRFVKSIVIRPMDDLESLGLVTFNVSLHAKGNIQATQDFTLVVLDLGHSSAATATAFAASTAVRGSIVTTNKGVGLYGMLVSTVRIGPLYNNGTTLAIPASCTASQNAGTTCPPTGGGSAGPRFAFDTQSGLCVPFQFTGCGGTANNFATLAACEILCRPTYTHTASINTSLAANNIGLSLIMVTFTSQGVYTSGRSEFLSTAVSGGNPLFPRTLSLQLPVQATAVSPQAVIDIGPIAGYSPLVLFDNNAGGFVNADTPTLPANQTNIAVFENTLVGSSVIQFQATDGDYNGTAANAPFTYSFETADGRSLQSLGPFTLNSTTGNLTVAEPLDFENTTGPVFTAHLRVNDNGLPVSRSSVAVVTVSLIDLNDNPPVFTQPSYSFIVPIDAGPGVVGAVRATDRDSNTALGGNNSGVVYSIVLGNTTNCTNILAVDANSGNVSVTQALNQTRGLICILRVDAANEGSATTPATSLLSFRFVNNNFAVSITLEANIHDFRRQPENATCLQSLEPFVGGTILLIDTFASATSPDLRTEVIFFVQNANNQTYLGTEVTNALLQNPSALGRLECSGWDESPRSDSGHTAGAAFYEDDACLRPVNFNASAGTPLSAINDSNVFEAYGGSGVPHQCLASASAGMAARVTCAGLPDGNASIRIFYDTACAPPTFVAVNTSVTPDGTLVGNYDCVQIEAMTQGAPRYVRAFCEDVIITSTSTTSSTVTSSTSMTSTSTASTLTTSVSTLTSTTPTTTTSTNTRDQINFAANAETASSEFPLWIVVGCALAVLLCWMIAMVAIVRNRRKRDTETFISPAFPVSGDVAYTEDDAIQGGIVTATGTIETFGGGVEDAAMHSVRFNPITALTGLQEAGLMDENDNDSLGDLSDFDEADFEEFADSLLQTEGGAAANDELFGQLSITPAAQAQIKAGRKVSFTTPNDSRYSTYLGAPQEDDLSDFENDESDSDVDDEHAAVHLRPESFMVASSAQRGSYAPQLEVHQPQWAAAGVGHRDSRVSNDVDAMAMVVNVDYSDISHNVVYP